MSATPPRRRRLRARLLAVAAGVALALLAAEAGLRLFAPDSPVYAIADDVLGYRLRPGVSGVYAIEGRSHFAINGDGWRDVERPRDKPPGTLRIAVLGDSFTLALQVEQERTFWWILGERLRADPRLRGRPVEVLNFGVNGFGTAQELLALRHYAGGYAPDLVLLAFVTGNDVMNNSRALQRDAHRPYFVRHGEELVLDDSFRHSPDYRLRSGGRAALFRALCDWSRLFQVVNAARTAQRQERSIVLGQEAGLSDNIYGEPKVPEWQEAWRVTEMLLEAMDREARAQGARLLVTVLSNGIQVHPDAAARQAYAASVGAQDLDYPNRRIAAHCASRRIAVLDLVPVLGQRVASSGAYLHGFGVDLGRGHWNEAGHRAAAEALAEWVAGLVAAAR